MDSCLVRLSSALARWAGRGGVADRVREVSRFPPPRLPRSPIMQPTNSEPRTIPMWLIFPLRCCAQGSELFEPSAVQSTKPRAARRRARLLSG